MKNKFLALVEEVKTTDVVSLLYETERLGDLKDILETFEKEHEELFREIREWAEDYSNSSEKDYLFEKDEDIDDPMEIAIVIYIIDNAKVTEVDLFEDWEELMAEIANIGNYFTSMFAKAMREKTICDIEPEDIFFSKESEYDYYDDDETEEEEY